MDGIDVSIIIRTLNEARYLGELLSSIQTQDTGTLTVEVVLVDSGSDDQTLAIAQAHGCVVTHISKDEFSFGRSLNRGCEVARGKYLVMVSGHCIPAGKRWLLSLLAPLINGHSGYSYGKQIGKNTTKYSEQQLFERYYPEVGIVSDTDDFFCNNANAAIARNVWSKYTFDEELTGLEDLALAKDYFNDGGSVAYVPEAVVFHIHDERWTQVKIRYEREAIALQSIYPQIHFSLVDFCRYTLRGIFDDCRQALRDRVLLLQISSIVIFRLMQYWGTYVGNNDHRVLSGQLKQRYFYPNHKKVASIDKKKNNRTATHEGA